jgi:hypothetical protein
MDAILAKSAARKPEAGMPKAGGRFPVLAKEILLPRNIYKR